MIKLITMFLIVGAIGVLVVGCTNEDTNAKTAVKDSVVPDVVPSGDAGRRLLFQLRCDEGHGGMCGELALMYKKGYGGIKSAKKAKELYKKLDQMTYAYSDNAEALQMVTLGMIATTLISCLQEMEDISETLRHTYYDSKR